MYKNHEKISQVINSKRELAFCTNLNAIIRLSSCDKAKISSIQNAGMKLDYRLDNIPIRYLENTNRNSITDINQLLLNPEDSDDEKINQYLYKLSLATRELIKYSDFNETIIRMAKDSETNSANLLDLAEEAPNYYDSINNRLAVEGLSISQIASDLTHRPIAPNPDYPITGAIEYYVPAIFIPNPSTVNSNLQPIISPNIEVDARYDESLEDNIVAWFYSGPQSEVVTEICLSEESAMNSSNPIFLLDNSVLTLATEQDLDFVSYMEDVETLAGSSSSSSSEISFSSYEFGIKESYYMYEPWQSGKSEFSVSTVRIDDTGTLHLVNPWGWGGTFLREWRTLYKIDSDDDGVMHEKWRYHASNWQPWSNPWTPQVIQSGVNMVFWNTFERDWNRSPKPLGTCTASGLSVYLQGNMKYNDNWYTWIPNTTQIHYTRFQWLDSNWAHWNNSWKAWFRLWKV